MKYYLINDASVQWFTYIIFCKDIKKVETEIFNLFVPNGIIDSAVVIRNILQRDVSFNNISIRGQLYDAWSISKYEFEKIKRLVELWELYKEYVSLVNSN